MSRSLLTLFVASGVIALSGCKETKSEAWYKQHPDETYTVYAKYLKDGEASDNCEFAHRAAIMFAQNRQTRNKGKIRSTISARS